MKIFISVPMKDKTDEEIKKEITIVKNVAKSYFPEENALGTLEFVDDFKKDPDVVDNGFGLDVSFTISSISHPKDKDKMPLYCLGEALQKMSNCDAVMFPMNWECHRGCRLEFEAADKYGLKFYFYDSRAFDKPKYIWYPTLHNEEQNTTTLI